MDVTTYQPYLYPTHHYKKIREGVFSKCHSLTAITLPSTLERLPDDLFRSCSALVEVKFNSDGTVPLRQIGNRTFMGCAALHTIELPNSIQRIGRSAFEDCTSLREIRFPISLEVIDIEAFKMCNAIEKVLFHPKCNLKTIASCAFYACTSLSSFQSDSLHNSLEKIGNEAFAKCSSLMTIDIPNNVENVGDLAFADCSNLSKVVLSDSLQDIGNCIFKNCQMLKAVQLPQSLAIKEMIVQIHLDDDGRVDGRRARTAIAVTYIKFLCNVNRAGRKKFLHRTYSKEDDTTMAYPVGLWPSILYRALHEVQLATTKELFAVLHESSSSCSFDLDDGVDEKSQRFSMVYHLLLNSGMW